MERFAAGQKTLLSYATELDLKPILDRAISFEPEYGKAMLFPIEAMIRLGERPIRRHNFSNCYSRETLEDKLSLVEF